MKLCELPFTHYQAFQAAHQPAAMFAKDGRTIGLMRHGTKVFLLAPDGSLRLPGAGIAPCAPNRPLTTQAWFVAPPELLAGHGDDEAGILLAQLMKLLSQIAPGVVRGSLTDFTTRLQLLADIGRTSVCVSSATDPGTSAHGRLGPHHRRLASPFLDDVIAYHGPRGVVPDLTYDRQLRLRPVTWLLDPVALDHSTGHGRVGQIQPAVDFYDEAAAALGLAPRQVTARLALIKESGAD